jgi:hypothetical protein
VGDVKFLFAPSPKKRRGIGTKIPAIIMSTNEAFLLANRNAMECSEHETDAHNDHQNQLEERDRCISSFNSRSSIGDGAPRASGL